MVCWEGGILFVPILRQPPQTKGGEYSKNSLINIRAGPNRHITSPPWN